MIHLDADGAIDHHLASRKVDIFQDPITETDREGQARVLRVVRAEPPHYRHGMIARRLVRCEVEFAEDPGDTYSRAIQIERNELQGAAA